MTTEKHSIVIVGGGTGGIATAAHLLKEKPDLDVAIIEPADTHYYQPGWTFVGGGIIPKEKTARPMRSVIPKGAKWIQDAVESFDPENNALTTASGKEIGYDYLVMAAGIQIDWDAIPGLKENLGKNGIVSNYDYQTSEKTWKTIKGFKGGTALFTQPKPPFKCPGAAQKIVYLAAEAFKKQGVKNKTNMIFSLAAPGIFPIKKYGDTLREVLKRNAIDTRYGTNLVAIDAEKKEATIETLENGETETIAFDMLHVTPPMSAPNFIKNSPLADEGGWVDVNMHTLQHNRFNNVFGLGDCTNTPNSKTAAAVRGQTPIVVSNLLSVMNNQPGKAAYDGYASCPLVTGYGKLVLAEFDYNMQPKETFPFDQGKERKSMYYLKKYVLPKFYWDILLKGGNLGGD
ncbi:MAG: NAD(P)/FAD-dependent oxidoreductase [Gammaproteobacteria bacterium]|nr:MAG: NAD(P)/FAD-dependent oxidoreductase [Gammaproteobacteria bacterium]